MEKEVITIKKIFSFDAAHKLPWHKGKCQFLHGHTYKLEVYARGELDQNKMVIDFGDLKALVKEVVLDKYDHKFLNDFFGDYTTAENMVSIILKDLKAKENKIIRVILWEQIDSSAAIAE